MPGHMPMKQFSYVHRSIAVQSLVRQKEDFKHNPVFHGKPVQGLQDRAYVFILLRERY